jgi:hypothetical protein
MQSSINIKRALGVSIPAWLATLLVASPAWGVPELYQPNYDEGYGAGYTIGYDSGFPVGQERGLTEGTTKGRDQGYTAGWDEAYQPAYDLAYTMQFPLGAVQGYDAGLADGFSAGYEYAEQLADYYGGFSSVYDSAGMYAGSVMISTGGLWREYIGDNGYGGDGSSSGALSISITPLDYDWAAHFYNEGFTDGKKNGYSVGDIAGYDAAYPAAFAAAFDLGHAAGIDEGGAEGASQGGFAGFNDGWDAGYAEGEPIGFDAGFASYVHIDNSPPTFEYTPTFPVPYEPITPVVGDWTNTPAVPFVVLTPLELAGNFTLLFPTLIPPLNLEVPEPSTLALAPLVLTAFGRRRNVASTLRVP